MESRNAARVSLSTARAAHCTITGNGQMTNRSLRACANLQQSDHVGVGVA
jgi:hypothetical protein